MSLAERYKQDGIWTMDTPRSTCVVPEQPLLISQAEEQELNQLSLATWNALSQVVDMAIANPQPLRPVVEAAARFPQGLTLPPAIRIDTVRTEQGPKIVEIDPITAISLGETAALTELWREQGFAVPGGLVEAIDAAIPASNRQVAIDVPASKREYTPEISFLANQLAQRGITKSSNGISLSAFNDTPAVRRRINREGWPQKTNPLWGPLVGLAAKTNTGTLLSGDKIILPTFLPQTYSREQLAALAPETPLVAKPNQGMGSVGVRAVMAGNIGTFPPGYTFQQQLEPLNDNFGIEGQWVSRVSIYAGRYGLLGAQVTARRRQPGFTNVHGQADAIQTTLAVVA